ncbi:UNVERIFIED_CONTAM: cAMP-specific 3',5'-cyclic phosphodiesterase 4B [Siphonaria sp. JEL0065]|nr:cAMP-specific 3',5'-cyclic phosphodiesterase 4B [Siphonaria sp. JEL0065]
MEKEYRPLPYHNCIHASDVLQSFYYLAFHSQWGSKFSNIEKLAGIIAAVGHDIDHPGVSNQFLVKARDPIAIMYSDASVNEYHHSAHMFSVTLSSQYNIFSSFSNDEFEEVRRIIIKLILATDMGKHFEILSKFKTKVQSTGFRNLDTQENRLLVLEIALKCGDLNNPSKNQEIAVQWAYCIMEEFYRQGDKERELGFPISNFMDRNNSNVAKCQVGFIDLLVAPLYGTWALLSKEDNDNSIMKSNINTNKKMWQHIANIQADPNFSQMRSFAKSSSSIASCIVKPSNIPNPPAVPALPEIFVMRASGKSLVDIPSTHSLHAVPMPELVPPPTTNSSQLSRGESINEEEPESESEA